MTAPLQTEVDRTAIHRCLTDSRRRYTLQYLRREGTAVSVDELAEQIAGWETEMSRSETRDATIEDVAVSLYHSHLPMLAEADLVQYDRDRQRVELADCPDAVFDGESRLTI